MIAATAIALPLVQTGLQALAAPNQKDAERFATADGWYQRAIAGDSYGLCKLKYMGGRRGSGTCNGESSAGFATQVAKDYTEQLYQQALQVLNGQLSAGTPTPAHPAPGTAGGGLVQSIAGAAATSAQQSAALAGALGTVPTTTPQQKLQDALTVAKWGMVLAGVGVLAYLVFRARNR